MGRCHPGRYGPAHPTGYGAMIGRSHPGYGPLCAIRVAATGRGSFATHCAVTFPVDGVFAVMVRPLTLSMWSPRTDGAQSREGSPDSGCPAGTNPPEPVSWNDEFSEPLTSTHAEALQESTAIGAPTLRLVM